MHTLTQHRAFLWFA